MVNKVNFKKLLSSIGLLAIITPVSLNVTACGVTKLVIDNRLKLSNVIKVREVKGTIATDADLVLKEIAKWNSELSVADVEVKEFIKATELIPGSAKIVAREKNTKYTGEVPVTITALPLIKLDSVIKNTQVDGNVATDADLVLKEIAKWNSELLVDDVEVKEFIKATEGSSGSAKIVAKPNTKYTGEVPVTITALPLIKLDSVIKNTQVDGNVANDSDLVLKEIARLNPELSVDDVEIINFKPANYNDDGSATIIAKENTKYTGEVPITITTVIDSRLKLIDVFSKFSFQDSKAVPGFLDFNDEQTINEQILRYLNETNLDDLGLVLENRTATSIIVKAKPDSKNYQGEVKLNWNLKLFEIYGIGVGATQEYIANGLKNYFYIEQETNKIKLFDAVKFFINADVKIHDNFSEYHSFKFSNQLDEKKEFVYNGRWWSSTCPSKFGEFNFTTDTKISINSPELKRVKIFNQENKTWTGLIKSSEYILDQFGIMNEYSEN